MRNTNSLEILHTDRMMVADLGLGEDLDVIAALNDTASDIYSVDENGSIWGCSIDESEYENIGLRFTTERGLGYYASYSPVLPADLMM